MSHHRMIGRRFAALMALAVVVVLVVRPVFADGGHVLPPGAKPSGFTLQDMAGALAYFSTSGNDLAFYPDTPFQILFVDRSTGTNTFHVKAGTRFFVPVAFIDDSPPILGDFPADASTVEEYVFGADQLGAHDLEIEVDGRVTSVGPDYVAGPVFAPGLLDGGGSHLIQIGAFLTPLSKGTHEVAIRGILDGDAVGGVFAFEVTYTVIVH